MTYPGLMLLIGVGIGIATLLYYVFSENENDPQFEHGSNNGGPSDHRRVSRYLTSRPEMYVESRIDVYMHMPHVAFMPKVCTDVADELRLRTVCPSGARRPNARLLSLPAPVS